LECQKKHGDVFTLFLGGRYFTYIMDPNDMKLFFVNNDKVSFDDAAVEFTSRVFGVSREDFFQGHKELIGCVRNAMGPNLLEESITKYVKHLKESFSSWKKEGEGELYNMVSSTVYWSNIKSILKEKFDYEKYKDSEKLFHDLDENFEIAAAGLIPEFIFKPVANARSYFFEMFDSTIGKFHKNEDKFDSSIYSLLLEKVGYDVKASRDFGIAILWAAEANSLPGTYWAIVHVLKNPKI
jgi:hypothetical protein